jgi:hypothetical protein
MTETPCGARPRLRSKQIPLNQPAAIPLLPLRGESCPGAYAARVVSPLLVTMWRTKTTHQDLALPTH